MTYPPRDTGHRAEMDRMRRRRIRHNVIATAVLALVVFGMIVTAAWLLTHPEAIGAFVGRVVAGAKAAT